MEPGLVHVLLHDSRSRRGWRLVLAVLAGVSAGFAFAPTAPQLEVALGDKINHVLAFLSMGAVAVLAQAPGVAAIGRALLGLLAYGVFIELVQTQIPGRDASGADVLADLAGAGAGIAVGLALRRFLAPRRVA